MRVTDFEKLINDSICEVKKMKLAGIKRMETKIPSKHFNIIKSDYIFAMDAKIDVYSRMIKILGSYLKESLNMPNYSEYMIQKSFQIVCIECRKSYEYINKIWNVLSIKEPLAKAYLKQLLEDERKDYDRLMLMLDDLKSNILKQCASKN